MEQIELFDKVCGVCNWYNTGFCSSPQIINHLLSTTGEEKTFLNRDRDAEPILAGCFMRASSPVTEVAGRRARHTAPSSTVQFIHKPPSPIQMVGRTGVPEGVPTAKRRDKRTEAEDIDVAENELKGGDAD